MKKRYWIAIFVMIVLLDALILPGIERTFAETSDTDFIIDTFAGTSTGMMDGGFSGDGGPAVSAKLYLPLGVAVSSDGSIYIADTGNNRIRKVDTSGVITTVAGTGPGQQEGEGGYSGDGGPATSATLYMPYGVALDSEGNLYIADSYNHRVRKVDTNGVITTIAGVGTGQEGEEGGFSGDGGPAISAELNNPTAVAVDSAGNIYIADRDNHRIRKVDANGVITTVAGTDEGFSGDGGPAMSAQLSSPHGVATAGGNIYIADTGNDRIRKVDTAGDIATVAGTGTGEDEEGGFSGDGGPATAAELNSPTGVVARSDGTIFFADSMNHRLRQIDASGVITTVAGTGLITEDETFSGDGGLATEALLCSPAGMAVGGDGTVYFADSMNHRIRKLVIPQIEIVTTVLAPGVMGSPYQAQLEAAGGISSYTWTVIGLPAGLQCSAAGVISGTPGQAGASSFVDIYELQVTVEDAGGRITSKTLTWEVYLASGNGAFIVTPQGEPAYTSSLTGDGIVTMTVKSGISGLKNFSVMVTPVSGHSGDEVLVFVHLRDGQQRCLSTLKADFDVASLQAGASFNVRPGDIVKVYLIDNLTNDPTVNPVVL